MKRTILLRAVERELAEVNTECAEKAVAELEMQLESSRSRHFSDVAPNALKRREMLWDIERYHWAAANLELSQLKMNISRPTDEMVNAQLHIEAYNLFCKDLPHSTANKKSMFSDLPEGTRKRYIASAQRLREQRAKAGNAPRFKTHEAIKLERSDESWDF
eukprot:TRINITY_DN30908_c0_g1_i1.p1 TRINITY_DN30908_c0_g1~~TRINITY_DN30908_c0_g1_i1.p1  ORF type:complete len:161 (+),score=33.66 TRINITY_DN30908_c0_g1_i1:40-522(+)